MIRFRDKFSEEFFGVDARIKGSVRPEKELTPIKEQTETVTHDVDPVRPVEPQTETGASVPTTMQPGVHSTTDAPTTSEPRPAAPGGGGGGGSMMTEEEENGSGAQRLSKRESNKRKIIIGIISLVLLAIIVYAIYKATTKKA